MESLGREWKRGEKRKKIRPTISSQIMFEQRKRKGRKEEERQGCREGEWGERERKWKGFPLRGGGFPGRERQVAGEPQETLLPAAGECLSNRTKELLVT